VRLGSKRAAQHDHLYKERRGRHQGRGARWKKGGVKPPYAFVERGVPSRGRGGERRPLDEGCLSILLHQKEKGKKRPLTEEEPSSPSSGKKGTSLFGPRGESSFAYELGRTSPRGGGKKETITIEGGSDSTHLAMREASLSQRRRKRRASVRRGNGSLVRKARISPTYLRVGERERAGVGGEDLERGRKKKKGNCVPREKGEEIEYLVDLARRERESLASSRGERGEISVKRGD